MGNSIQQPNRMMSYLLGELNEAETERMEELYFYDNDTFLQLIETEDQLINNYLSNRLADRERYLFEHNYLTSRCREQKCEFAGLLRESKEQASILGNSIAENEGKASWFESFLSFFNLNRPLLTALAVTASVIIVSTVLWMARHNVSPQDTPEMAKMSSQAPFVPRTGDAAKPTGRSIISLELSPEPQRKNLVFSDPETRLIELKLLLTGDAYPGYRGRMVSLADGAGEILSEDSLRPVSSSGKRAVTWKVEASMIPAGEYRIDLQGVAPNVQPANTSTYRFSVRSQ